MVPECGIWNGVPHLEWDGTPAGMPVALVRCGSCSGLVGNDRSLLVSGTPACTCIPGLTDTYSERVGESTVRIPQSGHFSIEWCPIGQH